MFVKSHIIVIILFFLYLYSSKIEETYKINYSNPPFKYKLSKLHWQQAHLGHMNKLKSNSYYNFDGSFIANPKDTYFPRTIQEVKDIIKTAYMTTRRIRVSGSHHTMSDISISDDIIIKTYYFKNILNLDVHQKQITIECGLTLEDLNLYLTQNNLALSVLPSIQYQTIAGCIATSTHGSNNNMASLIKDITLIQANGLMKTFYSSDKEFDALTTSLGCLGFIYSITLQCTELFAIKHIKTEMMWLNVLKNFDILQSNNQYWQVYIWTNKSPNSKNCDVYKRRKVSLDEIDDKHLSIRNVIEKTALSYQILTDNQESALYTGVEYCLKLENLVEGVANFMTLIKDFQLQFGYRTSYPVIIKFGKKDNSLLGLSSQRNDVFYISTYNDGYQHDNDLLVKLFQELEILMINKFNGRPHYGYKNWLDTGKMQDLYGSNLDKFRIIRDKLDVKRVFSNDFVDRVIGL